MALPTLERASYEFEVNIPEGNRGNIDEDRRYALWKIHDTWLNFTGSPWTVHCSSNATVAGAGNNVLDVDDLVWNYNNPRSWICWNVPCGGQLLFDPNNYNYNKELARWSYSPEGLFNISTSTSTPPTAADEAEFIARADQWLFDSAGAEKSFKLHFIHDPLGGFDFFACAIEGHITQCFLASEVSDYVSGWDFPYFFGCSGEAVLNSTRSTYGVFHDTQSYIRSKDVTGGTAFACALCTEVSRNNAIGQHYAVPNQLSTKWPILPVGLASTVAGFRGLHGRVKDLWFTNAGTITNGDTLEEDALSPTKEFAVFGDLVVPWNGTDPEVV
jgi:hypothetical protein